jgi:hypothetical protein
MDRTALNGLPEIKPHLTGGVYNKEYENTKLIVAWVCFFTGNCLHFAQP